LTLKAATQTNEDSPRQSTQPDILTYANNSTDRSHITLQ